MSRGEQYRRCNAIKSRDGLGQEPIKMGPWLGLGPEILTEQSVRRKSAQIRLEACILQASDIGKLVYKRFIT